MKDLKIAEPLSEVKEVSREKVELRFKQPHMYHHAKVNLVVGKRNGLYTAYCAGSGRLHAVDLASGNMVWKDQTKQDWNG